MYLLTKKALNRQLETLSNFSNLDIVSKSGK